MGALTCADDAPLEALAAGALPALRFGQLVAGAHGRYAVSRAFSSLLQLVNNGNVRVTKLGPGNEEFELTLLDRLLPHRARLAALAGSAAGTQQQQQQQQRRQQERQHGGGRHGRGAKAAGAAPLQEGGLQELDGVIEGGGWPEAENVSQPAMAARGSQAGAPPGKPSAADRAKAGAKGAKRQKA